MFLLFNRPVAVFILVTSDKSVRLRVFEDRVLRRIFGPRRDGVTGE